MKEKTFEYIVSLIRSRINEEVATIPTNAASSGAVSGLSGKEGDLPPVDLRKRKYKKLPSPYRDLFRRKRNV
jgi:hypothetical protein